MRRMLLLGLAASAVTVCWSLLEVHKLFRELRRPGAWMERPPWLNT